MNSVRTVFRHTRRGLHVVAGLAIVLAACSSLDDDDDSGAGSSTTAASTTTTEATNPTTKLDDGPEAEAAGISFGSQVLPILETNCASCHTADGPGAAHLSLETADDATGFNAEYIATVIDVGYMPPWPAADGDVAFHDDRRLSESDRATITSWAAQGALIDIDGSAPIVAPAVVLGVLDRDAVLVAEPYKGSESNDVDDYRCQIYDPGITEDGYLKSFGIEPDQTEVVHHALLFHVAAEARGDADAQAAANPDIGWGCTALAGFGEPGQSNLIMSWAPGQAPTELPEGVGIETSPGDFFVVQIHYHYEPEWVDLPPDESRLVVDFADTETLAAGGGSLDPIDLTLYLGPAEIPCSTEETGPLCDRDAAIQALQDEQGFFAARVGDGLLAQCGARVEDFADMTDEIASSSCDHPAQPGQIISIWGHEHELGKSFKMTLNPDTPEAMVLLDIPRWSFDWQLNYEPIEAIVLNRGDTIRVECSWDRAKIPDDAESRYIVWSEGTNDEMCYSQIVTRPV
jgi:mono/diheme cytochrome c family protein